MKVEIEDLESAFAWAEQERKDIESKKDRLKRALHPTVILQLERDVANATFISGLLETIIDDVKLSGESIIECERP